MRMYGTRSSVNRAFDALIGYEIRRLNNHLPKERHVLSELLLPNDDVTIEAVDGNIILRHADLRQLAEIVPAEYHDKLRLPFIILRRMEMGRSIYTVAGDRMETFTIQKILGSTDDSFHEMYNHPEQMFLYRPEVTELVAKFHSLVVIGFSIPRDLADYAPKRD
jgi:uncharacterized protein (UPF0216 family)